MGQIKHIEVLPPTCSHHKLPAPPPVGGVYWQVLEEEALNQLVLHAVDLR